MAKATKITVKQKEAKTLRFTVTDNGAAQDLSTATLTLTVRQKHRPFAQLFAVADGSFDKTNAASGIVTCPVSSSNLDQAPGLYDYELKMEWSGIDISKSLTGDIEIVRSLSDQA